MVSNRANPQLQGAGGSTAHAMSKLIRGVKKLQSDKELSAPAHLSEYSKALWLELVKAPVSRGRLEALRMTFELLDDYRELQKIIKEEGFTVKSDRSGLTHKHPLLNDYLKARKELIKLWGDMGLKWDPDVEGFVSL